MMTVQEVYELRRSNINLTLFECIQELANKYNMDEKEVSLFVKSNKHLFSELQKECSEKRMLKSDKIISSTISVDGIF